MMATDPQFKILTTKEVIDMLKTFMSQTNRRGITQLHIHHTWVPNYTSFNGQNHLRLQQSMWNYHVNTKKWGDIAQHLTLYPDGKWVTGRDLNSTPASIYGWNTGALCVEMIGNFNIGKDVMDDAQKAAIYELTEFMHVNYKLTNRFHRDNPDAGNNSCPGSSIDREVFFREALNFTKNRLEKERLEKLALAAKELESKVANMRIVFKDMIINGKEHWANKYVNFLYDRGIIAGRQAADGSIPYQPDESITRAESATLIARAYEDIMKEIDKIKDALNKAGIKV